jgi:hypothetical protein
MWCFCFIQCLLIKKLFSFKIPSSFLKSAVKQAAVQSVNPPCISPLALKISTKFVVCEGLSNCFNFHFSRQPPIGLSPHSIPLHTHSLSSSLFPSELFIISKLLCMHHAGDMKKIAFLSLLRTVAKKSDIYGRLAERCNFYCQRLNNE